jgi:hypothetical protein
LPKYKCIQKTVSTGRLEQLVKGFEVVDRRGHSVEELQSLLAMLYWSGFKISEIIGGLGHKAVSEWEGVHYTRAWPPILKEQMWKDADAQALFIRAPVRKRWAKDRLIQIPLGLDFVDLIVKQWERTHEQSPVWRISNVTWWRVLQAVPKTVDHNGLVEGRRTETALMVPSL